jgi:uncharacterized protein YaiI (UPF0178 family)/RimJ/RimL family protein N-acetyltransferase
MTPTLERLAAAHAMLPVRRTERLVLRPWQEADRPAFAALNADAQGGDVEGMEFLPVLDRSASDARIDSMRLAAARRGFGVFAVEERGTRAFVGMIGLEVVAGIPESQQAATVRLVCRFGRAWWGQGLATEAGSDVLSWAFTVLRLPEVVAHPAPGDTRAARWLERIGMTGEASSAAQPIQAGALRYRISAPIPEAAPAPANSAAAQAAPALPSPERLPQVWIDGDGAPRVIKDMVWKAVQRGAITVTIVANRPLVVPRHRNIRTAVVAHGLDVADDWLVAHAGRGDLVITSDVPLAAELVAIGAEVLSPRGEWFTPSNIGEKLSLRDYFTEARASGVIEGGGPAAFDERAKRVFANGLDSWIQRASSALRSGAGGAGGAGGADTTAR